MERLLRDYKYLADCDLREISKSNREKFAMQNIGKTGERLAQLLQWRCVLRDRLKILILDNSRDFYHGKGLGTFEKKTLRSHVSQILTDATKIYLELDLLEGLGICPHWRYSQADCQPTLAQLIRFLGLRRVLFSWTRRLLQSIDYLPIGADMEFVEEGAGW